MSKYLQDPGPRPKSIFNGIHVHIVWYQLVREKPSIREVRRTDDWGRCWSYWACQSGQGRAALSLIVAYQQFASTCRMIWSIKGLFRIWGAFSLMSQATFGKQYMLFFALIFLIYWHLLQPHRINQFFLTLFRPLIYLDLFAFLWFFCWQTCQANFQHVASTSASLRLSKRFHWYCQGMAAYSVYGHLWRSARCPRCRSCLRWIHIYFFLLAMSEHRCAWAQAHGVAGMAADS